MTLNTKIIEETADAWIEGHPYIPKDWKKELLLWLKRREKFSPEFAEYMNTCVDAQEIRSQLMNNCINRARNKIEQEYKEKTTIKKGWLKEYRKSDSYTQKLNETLSEDETYSLLNSEFYEQSQVYKSTFGVQKARKQKQFYMNVEQLIENKLIQRFDEEVISYVKSHDTKEKLEKLNLLETVLEKIEKHLTTEKVKGPTGKIQPLEREIRNFVHTFVKYLLGGRLTPFINGHVSYCDYVYERIANKNKKIKGYESISKELSSLMKTELDKEYQLNKTLRLFLKERLTEEYILECLSKNPHYAHATEHVKRQLQYERYIKNGILDRIPERYEDLYPLARTMKRHFILHIGPTNSGKTYEAMQAFRNSSKGVYLGPLRLMAYEVHEESNRLHCPCHMHTGEEDIIVEGAMHMACTIEMADFTELYDVCVIDEAQMLEDESRGGAWTAAILGIRAKHIHVCAAKNAKDIILRLIQLCDDTYEIIEHNRMVPLVEDKTIFSFPKSVKKNDALIVFSKKDVLYVAAELQKLNWNVSVIYGALPYETRKEEVDKFRTGKTDIVVATDAIGMGMNLPVERIVFLKTEKFDGKISRKLKGSEIKQIAGRAGRKGLYEVGYFTTEYDNSFVSRCVQEPDSSIQRVYLDFPETLLSIDSRVSDILTQWSKMPARDIFWKQDINIMISLAQELENYSEDKNLIFKFVMIPFEERNHMLFLMWKKLFLMYMNNQKPCMIDFLDTERTFSTEQLDDLELEYKKCDMLYSYLKKFNYDEEKEYLLTYKKQIAKQISELLSEQKLPPKKCSICGSPLPWNYPYRECNKCHYSFN